MTRARKVSPAVPETSLRPVRPVAIWAGNRAIVEVILAACASMPVNISEGRVMKEPPPARAFCIPAHSEARIRITYVIDRIRMQRDIADASVAAKSRGL